MDKDAALDDAWPSTPALVERLLLAGGQRRVLVLGANLPPAANRPGLALSYVGPLDRLPPLRCAEAHLIDCRHPDEAVPALRRLAALRLPPHQAIFLDMDHRAASLVEQIRILPELGGPDALWLFDDAVPDRPEIATAAPLGGWWTGQVYAVPSLLEPVGDDPVAVMAASPPTGLGLFRGWRLRDEAAVRRVLEALPACPDAADLARFSALPPGARAGSLPGLGAGEDAARSVNTRGEAGRRVVEELEPPRDWERPPPRRIAQANASAPHDMSLFGQAAPQAHGSVLAELDDAVLIGFDALFRGATLHGRYTQPWLREALARRIAEEGAATGGGAEARPLVRGESGALLPDALALEPALRVEEPVLLGTPDEGANWGMWLLYAIASAELFHRHRDRYARYLCWVRYPWQRAMLEALGIAGDALLEQDASAPTLLRRVGLLQQTHRDLVVTPWLRGCIERFLDAAGVAGARPHRRLYVSRQAVTRAGAYRGLLEEDALAEAMAARGLEVVFPERLPFVEQARMFREAELVVGLGGAAMFNTVFCRPGAARVVTIEGTTVFAPWHCTMFASCGLDHGVILGEPDPTDPRPVQGRWRLDLPLALEGLDAMLGEWGLA